MAQQKRDEMLAEHTLVDAARAEAERIVAQAQAEAESIRREADAYALQVLEQLALQLERMLAEVRNGVDALRRLQVEDEA